MPEQYYEDALKLGRKEHRACLSRGEYPYLSVLNEMLPEAKLASGTDLGVVMVPSEFIVGTKNVGRTNTFARNFMPLAAPDSEFALKWRSLCKAHLEEGIRDPVKVYEYLNRYYVEEGNKRVSVLKFFDAVTIPAQVIRILPDRTPENELYFEFLDFYRLSKVNFIEFSKKGSYALLQKLLGKAPDAPWTEEERRRFASDYAYFRAAYEKRGGSRLSAAVGDAMLLCIQVYGYPAIRSMGSIGMKSLVDKMWDEMALQQEPAPIRLKTDPEKPEKPSPLTQLLVSTAPPLKVAFLYDRNPEVSGWVAGHELGRQYVQRVFSDIIAATAYPNCMDGDPLEVLEKAISDGAKVVFTTSPRLLHASLRAAVEHPEVTILNCSLNRSHRHLRTYYARMYEAKFIIGAMAGAMTEKNRIGYLCDYPIYGQIAGINAFALGAQMVNPHAKVYLEWSSVGSRAAATRRLTEQGIELISSQDMVQFDNGGKKHSFGLSKITEGSAMLLAAPVWEWGFYYEEILREILDKSFRRTAQDGKQAINYYWGMAAGVVDLKFADTLPASVRKLAISLKEGVMAGVVHPFLAPIVRQDGTELAERVLTVEQIVGMDYLVENVVGRIPDYHELNPMGQATVDAMGIRPAP